MILETLTAARDLGRLHEVAGVLVRHGFGDVARRLGVLGALERVGRVLPTAQLEALVALKPEQRVRRMLEELGPCFVKLGQVLATRVDLFAPEWIAEFSRLQNQVPAIEFEALRAQLEADLGGSVDTVFAEFERVPLAAASIAQVHRARLPDGRAVVVKVRRPAIEATIEADTRLLERLAKMVEAEWPEWRRYQPLALVRQLKSSLRRELDLAAEGRHSERIAESFEDDPRIVVPRVHWPLSGPRLNVQDLIEGVQLCDEAGLEAAGADGPALARLGAQAVLKMMFEDGFFHADPHAGNVFWLPGDRLALIDFGMVGRLSEGRRAQLVDLMRGLVARDTDSVVEVLLGWAEQAGIDEEALAEDIDTLIDSYHGVPLGQLQFGRLLAEVMALLREHRLVLPGDLALVIKVFVTLEGLGRRLDPGFDMAAEAEPFLSAAAQRRYHPRAVARRGWRAASDALSLLQSLPRELRQLLQTVRTGRFNVHIDLDRLKRFGEQVEHSINRLTVGIVTAALIIGSSIVMTVSGGPTLFGLPLFGLLGFLGAGLSGSWLVWSIWRSGGGR
jgi:ubiquinone biosynthesis protein